MNRPLNREILKLALPSILANITVPIVGMVDLAVAGHLPGGGAAAFIGGVTVGSMLFDILYWNFGFLRTGTGGLTAQAYGRGDMRGAAKILTRGVWMSLLIAIGVLLLQWPFSRLAMLMVDSSHEVQALALRYFAIRIWAAPATLSLMALRGWFIGMQDSVSSMKTDLIVNGVNIAASIVLSLGVGRWQGLGFPGVAVGTVVAQYTGLAYACLKVAASYRHVFDGFTAGDFRESLRREELRPFMSLNLDLFLRSAALTAIYISYTVISTHYGDLMIASAAIMMKLLMLFSFFVDGFAYAGEALTGKYIGRGNEAMMRKAVRYVIIWSMGVAALFVLVYWVSGVPLLRLLTSDRQVVDSCRQFLPWLILMPPLGCIAFTWDGIFTGATASRPIRNSMIWALLAFLAVWFAGNALLRGPGADGVVPAAGAAESRAIHILLAAYFVHLLVRSAYLTARWDRR